jgi:hypothetical protein
VIDADDMNPGNQTDPPVAGACARMTAAAVRVNVMISPARPALA